jgi:hypothetical protein
MTAASSMSAMRRKRPPHRGTRQHIELKSAPAPPKSLMNLHVWSSACHRIRFLLLLNALNFADSRRVQIP